MGSNKYRFECASLYNVHSRQANNDKYYIFALCNKNVYKCNKKDINE